MKCGVCNKGLEDTWSTSCSVCTGPVCHEHITKNICKDCTEDCALITRTPTVSYAAAIIDIADEANAWWGWDHGVIDGWRTYYRTELIYLVEMAFRSVPEGGTILEVGSYGGKTLLALGLVAQRLNAKVISVDPMVWCGDLAWPHLSQVLKRFSDEITFHKMTSQDAFDSMNVPTLDFIHIDGDHSDVLTDCRLWLPYLKREGIVVFHDAVEAERSADNGYCYQTSMDGSAGYRTVLYRKEDCYQLIRQKP